MRGHFLFLGTGGSMGIPVVGCHCPVCRSTDPCDNRLRAAAYIEVAGKKLLIDCGPDFRQQALRFGISDIDGAFITHAHHDHTASVDELRVFYMHHKKPLPCLMSRATAEDLRQRYKYIFQPLDHQHRIVSKIEVNLLEKDRGIATLAAVRFRYLTYEQMGMEVNGFVIGDLAYISDIRTYPETIFEDLKGVETIVVSALRFEHSDFHFTVDEAASFIEKSGARKGYLTHIAHELSHEAANNYLPKQIRMAYDGLQLEFNYTP